MKERKRERERTHLILSISSEDVKFSFMSSTSKLTSLSKLVWVTEKRSLFSFLFLFCSFLQGKTILEIKRITSEQFLEKKFHFFLKMCLNIISFSRFSGKSTIFSFGRLCQRLKKLFIFSSKEAEIIKIHFFKKAFPTLWCYV